MDTRRRRFIGIWLLASVTLAAAVAVFDAMVDPYLLFGAPRIAGVNARKPAVETRERSMKAYDVLRSAPNTVLLGSSRVDLGLDAQHPLWPAGDRPVYNLGIQGGTPYIAYRYLQHVMSQRPVALAVVGLDFEYFMTSKEADRPAEREFELRLAVTRAGTANDSRGRQHIGELFQAALSLDALTDSAVTVAANLGGESSDITAGNLNLRARDITAGLGSYPLVERIDLVFIRYYNALRGKHRSQLAMADLQALLDLCKSHGTRVIVFINPVHADMLEILDLLGYWPGFEDWKRELLALTLTYRDSDGRSSVPLWDFSGYDSYSTETVPVGGHVLYWFRESSHYTHALGDVIVRRILGEGAEHFGVLLGPDNLEFHLDAIREQQRSYREYHQADLRRVRDLYDSVTGIPSGTMARALR